mmetsp:Transcript_107332/g.269180  ORF Transcript_107332/g.269180 Transcript_107332/m.269180 type:complete len:201 (+) Transcript_107332:551-1153(+)
MAPSKAMGKLKPLPKNMKLLASVFWQPMSHNLHSPIFKFWFWPLSCFNGLDSFSITRLMRLGSSSNFCRRATDSLSGSVPHISPKATPSKMKAATVDEKTLVEEVPLSSPAEAQIMASLSRAIVDSASLTTASVRTSLHWPFTIRMLSTDSLVSPEFEMTTSTSPGPSRGFRYLYSEAYWTSTGMRAMCSIKYSANTAAW